MCRPLCSCLGCLVSPPSESDCSVPPSAQRSFRRYQKIEVRPHVPREPFARYDLDAFKPSVRDAVQKAPAAASSADLNHRDDLIVSEWPKGDRYAGEYPDGLKSRYGVYDFADGKRYEGAHLEDAPHGLGVDWTADGKVARQGRYENRRLVERTSPSSSLLKTGFHVLLTSPARVLERPRRVSCRASKAMHRA